MRKTFPFAEWLPDLPDNENPGALVATNVIPGPLSYQPFPNPVQFSTAIGSRAKGFIIARDMAGNYYNYTGDTSAQYALNGNSWSTVTRTVGGAYTTPSDDYWEYVQWGETVIAVNGNTADVPQRISLGAANFTALPGSPNKAKHIAVVRDFVVLGNLSSQPQTVQWCAINNSDSWTASAATLADSQNLPGNGGWIQKIIGGEYGMIFQERAIWRMTFIGSPLVFQFDLVHNNIGAYAPQSVVAYQNFAFFLAEDGFYMFDGVQVKPIGRDKVDLTFFRDLAAGYADRIQAGIDPINKLVMWAYPAAGNTSGNPNRVMVYCWGSNRWSRLEGIDVEYLTRNSVGGYTLDGLDAVSTSLDLLPVSLDSRQWAAGQIVFGCFDSTHKLCRFNGSAMAATVDTGEHQLNAQMNGTSYITEVRPMVEGTGASPQITVIARNKLNESVSTGAALTPNSTGYAMCRSTARFHRIRVTTANNGTFTHLYGVDVEVTPEGNR